MKFVCSQESLLLGVLVVQKAVSSKNTIPILGGIYLEATADNKLILRATDLEIGIEHIVNINTDEPGKVVLPARYFVDIVRRLPSTEISIQLINDALNIKYDKSKLTINCYPAHEFPNLPIVEEITSFILPSDIFKKSVKQVSIASSVDHNRPIFTGILMEFKSNEELILVATDTHRLALKHERTKNTSENNLSEKLSIIVPSKIMLEISRLIESESMIKLIIGKNNQVMFKIDATSIYSRLIQGQFPNYNQVIPGSFKSEIKVNNQLFTGALERAVLLVSEETNKKRASNIKLTFADNILAIDSYASEVGNIHEEINVDIEGEDLEISFNGRYILDSLKVLDCEFITFKLNGPLSPAVIEPYSDYKYKYLVLPVRSN